MGLKSYEARYTLQLQDWNERVFNFRGVDYEVITGEELDNSKAIVTGSVLDAHGRTYYSLSQTMTLIQMMKNGELTSDDVIFYEDMFTPGLECLPYIMDQSPPEFRPKVYLRFLAQTTDPDDFLIREGMFGWMRKYEEMVDEFVDGRIVEVLTSLACAVVFVDKFDVNTKSPVDALTKFFRAFSHFTH